MKKGGVFEGAGCDRYIAFGLSGETVLQVVYTWRGENIIRIISARKANRYDAEKILP